MQKRSLELRAILRNLSKKWFNIVPHKYQEDILFHTFNPYERLVTVRAATGAGKSYITALSALLYAIFFDNVRVGIIAPSDDKTKIIMDHVARLLASSPIMEQIVQIDTNGDSKLERLTKEVSKQKITLRNGSSIQIITADIPHKGQKLMGFGFNLVIIDESGEIPSEVYPNIFRMYVRDHAKIVELGNPWGGNEFEKHSFDPDWISVHIDWETCVREGRFNYEDVMMAKKNATRLKWIVMYEANFPQNIDRAIFTVENHLNKATLDIPEDIVFEKYLFGIDVARGGEDYTVVTVIGISKGNYYFVDSLTIDSNDEMAITGRFRDKFEDYYDWTKCEIKIDTNGLGGGLHDRLKELGFPVYEFKSGWKSSNKEYANLKAETVFGLAKCMYDGRFFGLPKQSQYYLELRKWTYDVKSDRQNHIIDPEDKSPDYADSLAIAFSRPFQEISFITDVNI